MEQTLIEFVDNTILNKNSTIDDIRAYFEGVLKLYQSGERFPINLDDVWCIAYSQKRDILRVLRSDLFVEGDDFVACQNGKVVSIKNLANGIRVDVRLTVNCFEFLVARKVRAVFNVYREVFKQIATGEVQMQQKKLSALEMFALQAQINLEQDQRIGKIENKLSELLEERENNKRLLYNVEISSEELPDESENVKVRKLVDCYVKNTGLPYNDVWNTVYETLEYRYGNRIRAYKKINSDKSLLDVAIRNNLGQKLYNVVSDMIRNIEK